MGVYAEPVTNLTPETFVAKIVRAYVEQTLRGRLLPIARQYRLKGEAP